MKKNIFLAGGGDVQNLDVFNKLFVGNLEKQEIQRVFYIPFGKKKAIYLRDFQKTKGYFKNITNILFILVHDAKILVDIEKHSKKVALFMPGGNAIRYIKTIRGGEYYGIVAKKTLENQVLHFNSSRINIEKTIVKFINDGGIYYGSSAGAMLAGKSLNTHMLETANEDREYGFNVLDGMSVAPHYNASEELLFYKYQEKELNTKIITLTENQGIHYNEHVPYLDIAAKSSFVNIRLEHIRQVQDFMILLDLNKEKLPFEIDWNWDLLSRAMQYGTNNFQEYCINNCLRSNNIKSNNYDVLNEDYMEYLLDECRNEHKTMAICEITCIIFARYLFHSKNKLAIIKNIVFNKYNFKETVKKNIIKIFDLLCMLKNNEHFLQ